MRTSDNIDLISAAFVLAQAEFPAVTRDKTNGQFSADYGSLDAALEACIPVLTKNGIGLLQPISDGLNGGVIITTRLLHKSGQWMEEPFTVKPQRDNPQGQGSAITYGRRYGAKSMLGLKDKDDDGAEATIHHDDNKSQRIVVTAVSQNDAFLHIEAAPTKATLKDRIPKMIEAFKLELFIDVAQLEKMVSKKSDQWGEDDFTKLEAKYRELRSKARSKSDTEAIKEILDSGRQVYH